LAKSLQEELKINEKKLYELETTYEKELLNKEKYTKALNQFKSDLISANTKKTTLSTQIKHVDKEKWLLSTDYNIADQINTLQRRYSQITVEFENLNNRLNSLVTELGKYEGIIQTKEKDLKLSIQEFKIVSGKLNKSIEKSDFRTEEQIKNILKKEMDIKKTSSDIEAFKQKLFSLKEQLDNLQLQAKDKEYDAAKYEKISRKLTELKSHIEKLGKELGSFEKERKTLKNKLLVKQKLESRQKEHKLRAENIATLKSLFKGSGFVNYVSSVYLQNLVNSANERFFRLTNQKLQLELTEDNNFEIRDFLNSGKTRNVKTLSGGQTFQASLSLALALADNIQSLTNSGHNFFFLDEGFGSLDKESLGVVFSTLKTLRKENRIVGIISHVDDLQQEVETYLEIENNPENGSLITKSWE